MVQAVATSPPHHSSCSSSSGSGHVPPPPNKRLTLGFLVSFMALCAKHASRVSNKLKHAKPGHSHSHRHHHHHHHHEGEGEGEGEGEEKSSGSPKFLPPPKSPLTARPKQLLTQISNKIMLVNKKKGGSNIKEEYDPDDVLVDGHDEFGEGGVWQRAILMGDKCQPLDFSGVIYYDCSGKQVNEVPLRSPRASPLPGYLTRGK